MNIMTVFINILPVYITNILSVFPMGNKCIHVPDDYSKAMMDRINTINVVPVWSGSAVNFMDMTTRLDGTHLL